MSIEINIEPVGLNGSIGELEGCHFCDNKTKFWNEHTNNPVCQSCAEKHDVSDLPDHGKRLRDRKERLALEKKVGTVTIT